MTTVEDDTVSGNGLAGITVHSRAPGQDLNGNVVAHNTIQTNNVDGDFDFAPHVDPATTGIIVATAVGSISITIKNNSISNDVNGIWHTGPVTISGKGNKYSKVAHHSVRG